MIILIGDETVGVKAFHMKTDLREEEELKTACSHVRCCSGDCYGQKCPLFIKPFSCRVTEEEVYTFLKEVTEVEEL